MVNKSRQVEPGKLTAYERWELPNIGAEKPASAPKAPAPNKIRPPTAEEIEVIRQQAFDEGKQEGFQAGFEEGREAGLKSGAEEGREQGFEQGLQEGQGSIELRLQQLDHLLSELLTPIKKQQGLIEEAILNVSMAVARAVIYRELSIDASAIKLAIEHILNDLPKADKGFVLSIHPQDESAVAPVLERYQSVMRLKLDDKLSVGGCILESSSQYIDYTIEKRFQKTVQSMLSAAMQNVSEQSGHELPSSINSLTDYPAAVLDEPSEQEREPSQKASGDDSKTPVDDATSKQDE